MELVVDDERCLRIIGVVDSHAIDKIRTALRDLAHSTHGDVTVNAQDMQIRDSALVGVFVKFHHELRVEGRSLVLLAPGPALERMLRVTRLGRVLSISRSGRADGAVAVRKRLVPSREPVRVPRPRPH